MQDISLNPEALTLASKRATAKTNKIIQLAISEDMSAEALDELIEIGAKDKAEREGIKDWTSLVKGQRYYYNSLVEFSKLNAEERLMAEYSESFHGVASQPEMIDALKKLMLAQ